MTRSELLLCPNWNYHDICEYVGCKKSKAYELMAVAREKYKGSVRFNSRVITRDSLLQAIGTSIERELYILNSINTYERRTNEKTL